ncbi:MAG: hypothetical protein ACLTW9_27160 [Enterocloster sp.]
MENERNSSIDTLPRPRLLRIHSRELSKPEKLLQKSPRELQLAGHMALSLPDCGKEERRL